MLISFYMRLWAIGWLALWGVVFGLNNNLVVFAENSDFSRSTTTNNVSNTTVQQQITTEKNTAVTEEQTEGGEKPKDEIDIVGAGNNRKIAKKNLKFIKTPFTEGSTADKEVTIKVFGKVIKKQKAEIEKYFYNSANPIPNFTAVNKKSSALVKDEITRLADYKSVRDKEEDICEANLEELRKNIFFSEGFGSIIFWSKNCIAGSDDKKFVEIKKQYLGALQTFYEIVEKSESQKEAIIDSANQREDNLKATVNNDPKVVENRRKYQIAKINEKENRAMLKKYLELFADNHFFHGKTSADLLSEIGNKEKIGKKIKSLEKIKNETDPGYGEQAKLCGDNKRYLGNHTESCNKEEIKVFIAAKISSLKAFLMHPFIEELNNLKIIDRYQNTFNDADKNLKKLIDRQSSQDYRDRLNEISERESKDYGFDTGTILRPYDMKNTTNFSLQRLLQKLLKVLVRVIGTFAVLGVMIGALLWLTAQGDENRITQGKEVVVWSCVGVALAYLSNILVNWWMNAVTVVIGG